MALRSVIRAEASFVHARRECARFTSIMDNGELSRLVSNLMDTLSVSLFALKVALTDTVMTGLPSLSDGPPEDTMPVE